MAKATEQPVVTELETTKRSIYMQDPFKLLIVGIDFGDESTPGYDPRVKLPLDPLMVASIKEHGVVRVVIARKDGERTVTVDGRRRVMHARAANLELQAENPTISADSLIRVPTEMVRGDEQALHVKSRIANAYAVKDRPLDEAKDIQRMIDKGASIGAVSLAFGLSAAVIGDRLKMLDLAPEAAHLLEKEIITANAALELAGVPMSDQVKILQGARDTAVKGSGKLSTAAITTAVRATRAATGAGPAVRKTPKERVADAYKEVEALARMIAESARPTGPDNRTASQPEGAAMFAVLRKVAKILHPENKTFDSVVKSLIPTKEDEPEEKEHKPARVAAAK